MEKNPIPTYHWLRLACYLFCVFSLIACNKKQEPCCDPTNPECPNYDPCYGIKPLSAKFDMAVVSNYLNSPVYWPDSLFVGGGHIDFVSQVNHDGVKHKWYLGKEIIEGVPHVSRVFSQVPRPATIEVTHVINYNTHNTCWSHLNGYDSVTQSFQLINRYSELETIGTFRGVIIGITDSFDITFGYGEYSDPFRLDPIWSDWSHNVVNYTINFDNNGDTLYGEGSSFWKETFVVLHENRQMYFEFDSQLYYGKGEVDDNGNMHLRYSKDHNTTTGDTTYIHFYGRKIN